MGTVLNFNSVIQSSSNIWIDRHMDVSPDHTHQIICGGRSVSLKPNGSMQVRTVWTKRVAHINERVPKESIHSILCADQSTLAGRICKLLRSELRKLPCKHWLQQLAFRCRRRRRRRGSWRRAFWTRWCRLIAVVRELRVCAGTIEELCRVCV